MYPWQNKGAYQWIPDEYAATSGADFGVTRAFDNAVIDIGRPQNVLPPNYTYNGKSGLARETRIIGNKLRMRFNTGTEEKPKYSWLLTGPVDTDAAMPPTSAGAWNPFVAKLMRAISLNLELIPVPTIDEGFGMSSLDYTTSDYPFYMFTTDMGGKAKITSVVFEYLLMTSTACLGVSGTPFRVVGLFDRNDVTDTWWTTARSTGGGMWGPPAEFSFNNSFTDLASSILGGNLMGILLPQAVMSTNQSGNPVEISVPELVVSDPGAYQGTNQDWSKTVTQTSIIKTSNHYWTSTDYFPALKAVAIVPTSDAAWHGSDPELGVKSWNIKVGGIRIYDALQVNAVPEHEETQADGTTKIVKAQFPCKIFGFAWRIMHAVHLSGFTTSAIQPPLATSGRPPSTFRFRLYDPDTEGLGVAHGVKFYYLLYAMAIPGTSPFLGTSSVVALLESMTNDTNLMFVQFAGIQPGRQTMTFIPTNSQYDNGVSLGRTIYAGQFAYSRQTIAMKCFRAQGAGASGPPSIGAPISSLWIDVGLSILPSLDANGTRAMWFDDLGGPQSWYTFLSLNQNTFATFGSETAASYAGGFSVATRGAPRVDLQEGGAFSMSTTYSDSFAGSEKITTYAKPSGSLRRSFEISGFCSSANMNSHLGTFVSDVFQTGGSHNGVGGYPSSVEMMTGDWRVRFVASVGDTIRDEVYILFRFAFVHPDIDEATINGSNLWSLPADQMQEFHFRPSLGGFRLASGPPDEGSVVSTVITTATQAYPISWICIGAVGGDPLASNTHEDDYINRSVYMDVPFSGARMVVQAWAVSFPISAPGNNPKNPYSDIFCPAVEFSWSGDTEAMVQTMIVNVKSNAIFAQRDSFVSQVNSELKEFISSYKNETAIEQEIKFGFRTWTKYGTSLSPQRDKFVPSTDGSGINHLQSALQLADAATTPSGFSITGFTSSTRYDGSESQAQIVDTLISVQGGSTALFGGAAILPQDLNISFGMLTNNSTFDGAISVTLYAVDSGGLACALIGESPKMFFSTAGNPAFSEPPPFTEASSIQIPTSLSIAGLTSYLMVRFKLWIFANQNAVMLSTVPSGEGIDRGFSCLDIFDFKIACTAVGPYPPGFPAVTDEQYSRGTNNWEMNLPVTTSRTFGPNEYYFVPDEDSVRGGPSVTAAASPYGEWHLAGWMFSPLWFIDMPVNSIFEIGDWAGLTLASQNQASGFQLPERAQRLMRVRTAIDTISAQSLSGTRDNMQWGGDAFVARAGQEVSGALAASNFLKITKFSGVMDTDHAVPDFSVRVGETFISGKNPLLVTMRTDSTLANRRRLAYTPASTQIKYLFYEMDEFDMARSEQSRIAMMASYDSYGRQWLDPYAESGSIPDETARVILTADMRMISGAVDPFGFTMYIVGYRSTNAASPQDGGSILMRQVQPRLLYDPNTAGTGPLHFVDGFLSKDGSSWNTLAGGGQQPLVPFLDTFTEYTEPSDVGYTHPNRLGDGKTVVPAVESFPDVVVDNNCNVYVMYSLLPVNNKVIGKVYCRMSHNGGYWFGQPYPVADLGYEQITNPYGSVQLVNLPSNDDSFHIKHITALFDHHSQLYLIFFWAGGKLFMRPLGHPAEPATRSGAQNSTTGYSGMNNLIYMVGGSTDFVMGGENSGSALDRWLLKNWDAGKETNFESYSAWYTTWASYIETGQKQNNYGPILTKEKNVQPIAPIRIARYSNDLDISPQRVGAFSTERGDVIITFLDSQSELYMRRIRFAGGWPLLSPALKVDTKTV